jgi:hypothetical protein
VFRRIIPLCCCLSLVGCGSTPQPSRPKLNPKASAAAGHSSQARGDLLAAYELARVEPGTYGPVSASLSGGTLSVWASPGVNERTWHSRVIDHEGRATNSSIVVGKSGAELGLVTLASVNRGVHGLLVFSTQSSERSTKLAAILLDATGTARTPVTDLITLGSSLLWMQIADTDKGPLLLYAVSRDDTAEVRALGITSDGKIRSTDRGVATGLRAWQAVAGPDGAALAVVRAKGRGGIASFMLLDDMGSHTKDPIDLDESATAELDLDLARVGSNYVIAWSDRRHFDSRIMLAAIDPTGQIVVLPRPGTKGIGEQSLIKLVPPASGGRAVLVWENSSLPFSRRMLSLSEVDEKANVSNKIVQLACSSRSSTLPEMVATEDGLRVITYDDYPNANRDENSEPMPTYVELGPELTPRAAVPLMLQAGKGSSAVPLLAWGLDCRHGCRATAALDDTPVTIATIPLGSVAEQPRARERVARLVQSDGATLPRLVRLDSIVEVEPLADLSVTRQSNGFLMSTITYFDPATPLKRLAKAGPDGRTDPLQARIDLFALGPDGIASSPTTLSYRASSLPGLSISAGSAESIGGAVAWSALDQGQPQVFVSQVGGDGKKRTQRMLTHKQGRLDEVELAPVDDGWILGWVDERTGDLEVYAARVGKNLDRRGNEQRITNTPGEVSALTLVPLGKETLVIFAEARRGKDKRVVSLFTRLLSSADAQPLEAEHRIIELSGAAKFMRAVKYGEGILLSWLEVATDSGPNDATARLYYVQLDAKGQPLSAPASLPVPDAVPAALVLDCPSNHCHGVAITDVGGRGELDGFTFDPRAATAPALVPLARSMGTVEQNVAPVLIGEHVFMVDQIDAERARVVHANIIWE